MNNPVLVSLGLPILEISKILMYEQNTYLVLSEIYMHLEQKCSDRVEKAFYIKVIACLYVIKRT